MTIIANFERFQYFNFETSLTKNENFFKKLEYCFLVESTKIKNASFPYQITALLRMLYHAKKLIKTNRMGSTKWTYHKERSYTSNFSENFVSVSEPLKKTWFDVPTTQVSIFIHFTSAGVSFEGAFYLSIFLLTCL